MSHEVDTQLFKVEHVPMLPPAAGAFCLATLLLFFKELTLPMREYLVPSLVPYVIGAAFISYVQLNLRQRRNGHLPEGMFWTLVLLHGAWFIAFLAYNLWRGSV